MAKGQHLSSHQRGIVKRYYEHLDSMTVQKLQEAVSDLFLAEGKNAEKLWEKARAALERAKVEPARIERSVGKRDVQELARLVGEMTGKK
jgi:hypothetical protein